MPTFISSRTSGCEGRSDYTRTTFFLSPEFLPTLKFFVVFWQTTLVSIWLKIRQTLQVSKCTIFLLAKSKLSMWMHWQQCEYNILNSIKDKSISSSQRWFWHIPANLYTVNIILTLLHFSCRTGDHRDDHSFVTTRTPKEAIMVMLKLENLKMYLTAPRGWEGGR